MNRAGAPCLPTNHSSVGSWMKRNSVHIPRLFSASYEWRFVTAIRPSFSAHCRYWATVSWLQPSRAARFRQGRSIGPSPRSFCKCHANETKSGYPGVRGFPSWSGFPFAMLKAASNGPKPAANRTTSQSFKNSTSASSMLTTSGNTSPQPFPQAVISHFLTSASAFSPDKARSSWWPLHSRTNSQSGERYESPTLRLVSTDWLYRQASCKNLLSGSKSNCSAPESDGTVFLLCEFSRIFIRRNL